MKPTFIDYFDMRSFKRKAAKNQAFNMALRLENGLTLVQALESIQDEASSDKESQAIGDAITKLKNGETPAIALNNERILLEARDRYVLSLNIEDRLKGLIIKSWNSLTTDYYDYGTLKKVMMVVPSIFVIVFIVLCLFVFPMFTEIFYSLDYSEINNSVWFPFLKFMRTLIPVLISAGLLIVTNVLVFMIIKNTCKAVKYGEEAELLAILSNIEQSKHWEILEQLSSKICFPETYENIKSLVYSIKNGESLSQSISSSKVSSYFGWFLQLAEYDGDVDVMSDATYFLFERVSIVYEHSKRLIEGIWIFTEALLVLGLAYSVVSIISLTLEGTML